MKGRDMEQVEPVVPSVSEARKAWLVRCEFREDVTRFFGLRVVGDTNVGWLSLREAPLVGDVVLVGEPTRRWRVMRRVWLGEIAGSHLGGAECVLHVVPDR